MPPHLITTPQTPNGATRDKCQLRFLQTHNVYFPFTKLISNNEAFIQLIQLPNIPRNNFWFPKINSIALPFNLPWLALLSLAPSLTVQSSFFYSFALFFAEMSYPGDAEFLLPAAIAASNAIIDPYNHHIESPHGAATPLPCVEPNLKLEWNYFCLDAQKTEE